MKYFEPLTALRRGSGEADGKLSFVSKPRHLIASLVSSSDFTSQGVFGFLKDAHVGMDFALLRATEFKRYRMHKTMKTGTSVVVRKPAALQRDDTVIRAKGQIDLEPRHEVWRLQWDEYIGSRMKQFNVR
jgi:hypothetical protein